LKKFIHELPPALAGGKKENSMALALAKILCVPEFLKAIFLNQFIKFLRIGLFLMVLFLPFDVIPYPIYNGFRDRNGKIFILPLKFFFANAIFIDPKRRFTFYQLHNLAHALINAKGNKAVNMIRISIDKVNINAFFFGVFSDMVKNSLSHFAGIHKGNSMLG
jgi:hypothetical protein